MRETARRSLLPYTGGSPGASPRREGCFVLNLKTAQALGLTIPQHVLLQATEIIQ